MNRTVSRLAACAIAATAVLLLAYLAAANSQAAIITLKNGVMLEGSYDKVPAIGDSPLASAAGGGAQTQVRLVVFVDDGLRRVFVPSNQVQGFDPAGGEEPEVIRIRQRVARSGHRVGGVGNIYATEPFDQYGRRTISLLTGRGRQDIVQGITKLTSRYTVVEGLLGKQSIVWEMRIATSSIPRPQLSAILQQHFKDSGADGRLAVVRLLTAAERYRDARIELEQGIKEFPELAEMQKLVQLLRQNSSQQVIRELVLRQSAGQHNATRSDLHQFQTDEVAQEAVQRVRELASEYTRKQNQIDQVKRQVSQLLGALGNADQRDQLEPICTEIARELNLNNLARLADYLRLAGDQPPEQQLSLLISGWLLGSGSSTENLSTSSSLVQVRDLVVQYLQTSPDDSDQRERILQDIEALEGGTPPTVAKIVALIRPPREPEVSAAANTDESASTPPNEAAIPGHFTFNEAGAAYEIQLPLEYDPYRRYPAIVTLSAGWSLPSHQIDWWAGGYSPQHKTRLGQATRHGYIVIAPHWLRKNQTRYEYSDKEHAAVLRSLRHAMRRFSIDTDRVFLSGHSTGGDAAWDIGLAHPDLWAGLIPIVAQNNSGRPNAPKFVSRYWENARTLPMYFIGGELDGDKLIRNGGDFDRYVKKNFDLMVVEYRGRGHEHFQDDIQHLFTWMGRQTRDFHRQEFKAVTMRPWDNFFWSLELDRLPRASMVSPLLWPKGAIQPATPEVTFTPNNRVIVRTGGAAKAILWLSPELIPLGEQIPVSVNGRTQRYAASGNVGVMLEDVRTRGDRQHPFWAKVELQTGRRR